MNVQQEAAKALRETKLTQVFGTMFEGIGTACALEVLCRELGAELPSLLKGSIVRWNDKYRLSFAEIADKIEEWTE